MKGKNNRREMTRVSLQVVVALKSNTKPSVSGQTTDVSLKGLHLLCHKPIPIGSQCQLTLILGSREYPIRIEVDGTVVRVDHQSMALEIAEEVQIGSLAHLHKVVLYNTQDPDQIHQEIQARISRRWQKITTGSADNKK